MKSKFFLLLSATLFIMLFSGQLYAGLDDGSSPNPTGGFGSSTPSTPAFDPANPTGSFGSSSGEFHTLEVPPPPPDPIPFDGGILLILGGIVLGGLTLLVNQKKQHGIRKEHC